MTDRTDELTSPFVQRLRDDLMDNLPRYRRRRRRRQRLALGTATVAVVLAAAVAGGSGGVGGGDRDDRDADVATEAAAPTMSDGSLPTEQEARDLVTAFLLDLRRRNVEAAAERWSGYPGSDDLADRIAGVEQMHGELPWLADPQFPRWRLEPPIRRGPLQVVTVTATTRSNRPVRAAAFVVDRAAGSADVVIERLPSPGPASTPASGTTVARGQEIVVPVGSAELVESELVAWFGGVEVATTLTEDGRLKVRVPDTATEQTVLTLLVPTPELPVAYAYWYPVGEG
jgi:hypothetical protein